MLDDSSLYASEAEQKADYASAVRDPSGSVISTNKGWQGWKINLVKDASLLMGKKFTVS